MRGRTSFLIAHRLASAVEADVIIACDQGRIVESGSHLQLLAKNGVYAQLYNEQTRKLMPTEQTIAVRLAARGANRSRHSRKNRHLKFGIKPLLEDLPLRVRSKANYISDRSDPSNDGDCQLQ